MLEIAHEMRELAIDNDVSGVLAAATICKRGTSRELLQLNTRELQELICALCDAAFMAAYARKLGHDRGGEAARRVAVIQAAIELVDAYRTDCPNLHGFAPEQKRISDAVDELLGGRS